QETHLKAGGVSPLSLPTFFAAAKKVGAAPHRGNANRPQRIQGKAKNKSQKKNPKKARRRQKTQPREAQMLDRITAMRTFLRIVDTNSF
ncbi:hypothetical protein SB860_37000, partial [Burkholderia sp. SIMBA_019]